MRQYASLPMPPVRLLGLVALLALGAGCQAFQRNRDPVYDQARREVLAPPPSSVSPASYEEPEPYDGFQLSDLSPSKLNNTIKVATGRGPNSQLARELYTEADTLFRQAAEQEGSARTASFNAAALKFKEAAARWPDSALEEDALFMVGECHFFTDAYPSASTAYDRLLAKYPHSRHMDRVAARRFSIAQYWLELQRVRPVSYFGLNLTDSSRPAHDTCGNAVRLFDKLRLEDPTGKLADDATLAAGNARFASGDYNSAEMYYSDLRKTFPSSEHQFNAHMLGLKASLESYRGPAYDVTPLLTSEKLVITMRTQFPKEAEKEKEYLARAWGEIRMRKAERDYYLAYFYDNRGEYGAARLLYDELVANYDDTPYADRAKQRLTQIADRPAVPPQRLGWLVRAIEGEQVKPEESEKTAETLR